MLPRDLHGPSRVIFIEPPADFLAANSARYPLLDPDFILQICFEHPDRFDRLFPQFDPSTHAAIRRQTTASWIYDMVRYDNDEAPDYWSAQFDGYLESGESGYSVFAHMVQHKTFPFPPVIIETTFAAVELGATTHLGKPYHLVEGTHRVSYLRRMLQREMLDKDHIMEVIEIVGEATAPQAGVIPSPDNESRR